MLMLILPARHAGNKVAQHLDHYEGLTSSAQSNFALDHLGLRIIEKLDRFGLDAIVLREVANNFDRDQLPPTIREHTVEALTARMVGAVVGESERRLRSSEPLTALERNILIAWKVAATEDQVEIGHRLRRSASVVLATCSLAAARFIDSVDPAASFEWVLIEEAAKAWPTELAMALVLGSKWILVGDHRQLGAFRGDEVAAFLRSLRNDPDELIQAHSHRSDEYLRVLELFGSMFDTKQNSAASTSQLSLQFRMDSEIAEPVSRAFYPVEPARTGTDGLPLGFLETAPRAERAQTFVEPEFVRGRSLIWIDTTNDDRCGDDGWWSNEGEADLVDHIWRSFRPRPAPAGSDAEFSTAVLTPYRDQVTLLANRVGRDNVHTVHSFQGREADCTIVSLVRDRSRGGKRASLGHVDKPELANVLLSRARHLQIIVGSLSHFESHGSEHWRTVCAVVRKSQSPIIDSREVNTV